MPVKNYVFGAKPPTQNLQVVDEQMLLAHRYRNRLCELELQRRDAVEECLRRLSPTYVTLTAAVAAQEQVADQRYAPIKARSIAQRKKAVATVQEKIAIAAANKKLKDLRGLCREQKKLTFADPAIQAELAEATESHKAALKQARADSGLYWGTYLTVEDACKTFGQGPPPRFMRWTGDGCVAVQIQHGMSVGRLVGGEDTRLSLSGDRKWRVLRIRIGSEGRRPVWACVPVSWHRELPKTARIKWAYLHRRSIAGNAKWTVRICVECPQQERSAPESHVTVHVGWRSINRRLRIAKWLGSDGVPGELWIVADKLRKFRKPHDLQSIRTRRFNAAVNRLCQWVDAASKRGVLLPNWLTEARQHMRLWRSQSRLARLLATWRHARFIGDARVYRLLHGTLEKSTNGWRKKDRHLWAWQANQSISVRRWRDDYYRVFARRLAERYGRVCVMQAEWAAMRERPAPGEVERQTTDQRYRSAAAAVATLERFLLEAFGKDCQLPIDIAGITATCSSCGEQSAVDDELIHLCPHCGLSYDVDENALLNQHARATAAAEDLPSLADVMAQRVTSHLLPKVQSVRHSRFTAARDAKRKSKGGA